RLGARGIARKTFGEGDRPTNEPAGSGSGAAVDLDETPGAAARKYDRAFGDRDASLPVGQVGRRAQPLADLGKGTPLDQGEERRAGQRRILRGGPDRADRRSGARVRGGQVFQMKRRSARG